MREIYHTHQRYQSNNNNNQSTNNNQQSTNNNNQSNINNLYSPYNHNINNQINKQSHDPQRQQLIQTNKINFYYGLQHYHPICGSVQTQQQLEQQDHQLKQHYHIFLINNGWWKSLICILLLNAAFILIYLKFVLDDRLTYTQTNDQQQQSVTKSYQHSSNYTLMSYLMIITLSLINLSYLFTQFLNPGVRNVSQIPHQQLTNAQKISYCEKCQHYKTQKFTHCSQCQLCIWNYDHHCGFFSKCIGGKIQIYAFYVFLASVTAGFLVMLGCMCIQMGQM